MSVPVLPQSTMSDIASSDYLPDYEHLPPEAKKVLPQDCSKVTHPEDFRADTKDAETCYADGSKRAQDAALIAIDPTNKAAFEAIAKKYGEKAAEYSDVSKRLKEVDADPAKKSAICDAPPPSPEGVNALQYFVDVSLDEQVKRNVCQNRP